MFYRFKQLLLVIMISVAASIFTTLPACAAEPFVDVPADHWASGPIEELRTLGYSNGIGDNQFGLGQTITRAQFAAFLVNVMEMNDTYPQAYTDNTDENAWYYTTLNAIAANHVTKSDGAFRPDDAITRAEMAEMMIGALGFYELGFQLEHVALDCPFTDVTTHKGFITMAYDLGLAGGMGNQQFAPDASATREQAAAMLVRLHHTKELNLEELHGFYAISSVSQKDYIASLDSTGFGWARLTLEDSHAVVNTTSRNKNEYYIPQGFLDPYQQTETNNGLALLSVYADDTNGVLTQILSSDELRTEAVNEIVSAMLVSRRDDTIVTFDGVVLDFEALRHAQKDNYTSFLYELRDKIGVSKLYIAVHPVMADSYYDGYDYAEIGVLADRVILMAYDFDTQKLTEEEKAMGYTMTPLSPLNHVYAAVQACLKGGIPADKLLLGISIDSAQWKLKDGAVIHDTPYHPPYEAISARLSVTDCEVVFPNYSYNPYARYFNESDQTENVIWYENEQSIQAKAELARLCGLKGLSIWRLGLIPAEDTNGLHVWNALLDTIE